MTPVMLAGGHPGGSKQKGHIMPNYGPSPAESLVTPLVTFLHGGNTVDFTPAAATDYGNGTQGSTTGGGVLAGYVVVQNNLPGVALRDIAVGEQGALSIEGCFIFPKAASDGGMAAGTKAYWDATNKVTTGTATGNTYLGKVEITAATADTSVKVQMEAVANDSATTGTTTPVSAITATGTASSLANAAALATGFNVVAGADGTKCVALPVAVAGRSLTVKNNAASALIVFPQAGATINGAGSLSLAAYTCPTILASSATVWFSNPLLPS
jgi:predicted RecA/RadA family phage recombinase